MDTIVALATPPGAGGIAVVRISGPEALGVLRRVFRARCGGQPAEWPDRRMMLGQVLAAGGGHASEENAAEEAGAWLQAAQPLDEAMAVIMRGPHSYTREDVVEIHCHGGPWVAREVTRLAVAAGARPAQPGEFTRRAFQNGRIDLAQAEAVMALIGAQGERAARAAVRQLEGGVSRRVGEALGEVTAMLAAVEAALDFPEEVDEAETSGRVRDGAAALAARLRALCDARGGKLLRDGLDVVIAGRPNAGKSTLLNALLGEERAIVADLPGTTRDTLTERILLDGLAVQLTDTAGLRAEGDAVEALGISRARAALERADAHLIVLDAAAPLTEEDRELLRGGAARPRIVALNKTDLSSVLDVAEVAALAGEGARLVQISAETGDGLPELLEALRDLAAMPGEDAALTQARHIEAAIAAAQALEAACIALDGGLPPDIAAIDLHRAATALGDITGVNPREEVIDAVFANFCVGK